MFKEILLPTDGSKGVERAVRCAAAVARKFEARVHVLFVVEPPRFPDFGSGVALTGVLEALEEAGRQIVRETAQTLREAGVPDVVEVLREGHPAEEIVKYAEEAGIDLIVMGTHGRRGLDRILLGSVAEEVVRTAEVPVMTVRMRAG